VLKVLTVEQTYTVRTVV